MLDEFERVFSLLALNPRCGHPRSDLSGPRYRFWNSQSFLIAYLADRRPLFIVRVLHGARSPEELRDELRDT
jgi:plasmid stabilization system protein ParE